MRFPRFLTCINISQLHVLSLSDFLQFGRYHYDNTNYIEITNYIDIEDDDTDAILAGSTEGMPAGIYVFSLVNNFN